VKYIDLDRRFVSLAEAQDIDPEVWLAIRGADGRLGWKQLLERKRVVILAEAGSGKSTELEQQFRAWKGAGHAAFHGKLQTVGRRGLMAAIGGKSRTAFEAWQASDEPAWFFLDSVDEAKLDNIRLDDALGAIADVLDPYLGRAHIVLSGRHTDWEFRLDLERLADILPVPNLQPLEELSDQERLDDVIHNRAPSRKTKDEVKPEAPLVVVLAGLDEAQIRLFAGAAGITDLDAFCDALKRSDLLDFAKRPLDLDWLALGWKRDKRFGAFAHMLDQALQERSKETDPLRAQQAPLDPTRVRAALRRIGAALVLSRKQAIAVPDSGLAADPNDDAIDLQTVLPDWQPPDIQRLARLPAFDPGTPGRARLHNDNQGVVRGFLAADWMRALRANNCPVRSIFDLLFADVYGHAFVRPSMRETAAWLSLWDEDVANETLKRDPFVLLNFGDPGSLPPAVRERALEHFTAALVAGGDNHIQYDHDALRRFAKPDLASAIRKAWAAHGATKKVRAFLLQLIWLGEIEACSDLAIEAAYAAGASRIVVILAGRALMVSAPDAEKKRYAAHIKAKAATLPITAVWDGVDKLFPATLPPADFIAVLNSVDLSDGDSIGGLETDGAAWAQRLAQRDDLVALIEALDAKVARPYGDIHSVDDNDDRQILPIMVSAARRLLEVVGADEAPDAAIDALLRIGGDSRGYDSERNERTVLAKAMHCSSGRRRAAFWRAAHRLKNAKYLTDGLDSVWKMQHFGYEPGLVTEDADWLLADAPQRKEASERALGIDGAMWVWRATGKDENLLQRVRAVAGADAKLKGVIDAWTVERASSPEMVELEKRQEEMKRQDRLRKDKVSKSWKTFIGSLRDKPDQLRKLRPVTSDTVDRRLHDVWQLLSSADRGRSRYAIDTADALKPLLGAAAAQAVEDALIDFWRKWTPNIRSGRAEDKRDLSYSFDNMGIAGIAMEARRSPDWPASLSEADALRAAQFATLELNGFPSYVARLAARFPNAVRDALMTEIRAELDNRSARGGVLEAIANTEEGIARVLAQSLEDELRLRTDFGERHLNAMLEALAPVVASERREDLTTLLLERFQRTGALRDEQIEYLGAAFELDAKRAASAMLAAAAKMQQPERSEFLQQTMAVYFGRSYRRRRGPVRAPFEMLEELIRAAYGAIDPAHDAVHKGVYTPGLRDDAEGARSHLVEILVKTPGRASYEMLRRLNDDPEFNSMPGRFEELAISRAAEDSEHEPWHGAAIAGFEADFDDTPRTGADLLLLTRRRLEDIQHALTESDYAQAATLRELAGGETAVQNFIAERMRMKQGRAYSIEREVHVAGEKEPDMRVRARATDTSVAVEIKDLDSPWTLPDLEKALRDQLCGQYLRDKDHRHGILLLTHRHTRPNGWRAADGSFWALHQVVTHLQGLAAEIAAQGPHAPDAEILVIDVAEGA
jgi:hypothetical protein